MTPGQLPDGWRVVDFGSLITDSQNGCGNRSGQGRPTVVLRLADVSIEGQIAAERLRSIGLSDHERAKYVLKSGDLLAFRVNGSPSIVGRVISYTGPEGYAYCDHFIRFRLDEVAIDSRFAALAFQEPRVRAEVEARMVSSAGQNTVSQASFREIPLPLPPLAQQKRIVATVDALRAKVSVAQERLARVRQILKRFRQSVLAAACSGRLTDNWRGEALGSDALRDRGELPSGWQLLPARDVLTESRYGTSAKCDRESAAGVPVLRVPNIAAGKVDLADLKFAPRRSETDWGPLTLDAGDIIVCRTNGSIDLVGKAAVVPALPKVHSFASYLIRLRPNALVEPDYLHAVMSSPYGREQLTAGARTTAGQYNLNLKTLGAFGVPLPPREEQRLIVRHVETLFALADGIEKRLTNPAAAAETLSRSILAGAFRGELV